MINDITKDAEDGMKKALESFKRDLQKIRTGRANTSMLDGIKVDYYGTPTPVNQVATVQVVDARLITIKPWEKSLLTPIEKAIIAADIGITPSSDGEIIRLPIPPLNEERRKEIVKSCKTKGEDHKIAIRNERRDANEMLKEYQKDGEITEDDLKKATERVQKEVDGGCTKVDEVVAKKEKEVMEV